MTARSATLFLNKVFHHSCHFALNPSDTTMQYKRDHTASPADFDQRSSQASQNEVKPPEWAEIIRALRRRQSHFDNTDVGDCYSCSTCHLLHLSVAFTSPCN